jgi:glycine/D-amino acid oxidase-like deaminating enzyme
MNPANYISDVVVIGGGNIGSATAYGLAERGLKVVMLDEGDMALRSAHGNFGLVWYQGKGKGMPRYVEWSLEATRKWPRFAEVLERTTGVQIGYHKLGGFWLCRSQAAFAEREKHFEEIRRQSRSGTYDCELIGRDELQARIPNMALGPKIVGASFSPHDGHVNPLFLLRAMQTAFKQSGGRYYGGTAAVHIRHDGGHFRVETAKGQFSAPKLVLAAGVGIPQLAAMLDMHIPVVPERGQLLVTERIRPLLPYPISGIRQTDEGSLMLGVSNEAVGYNTNVTTDVMQYIAKRASDAFPCLGDVRIVRSWAALRPLTPDRYPIYHESTTYPGAFVLTSHSGVSLASLYATDIADWIAAGTKPEDFEHFSPRRFDV